jgi:hypothetical protein
LGECAKPKVQGAGAYSLVIDLVKGLDADEDLEAASLEEAKLPKASLINRVLENAQSYCRAVEFVDPETRRVKTFDLYRSFGNSQENILLQTSPKSNSAEIRSACEYLGIGIGAILGICGVWTFGLSEVINPYGMIGIDQTLSLAAAGAFTTSLVKYSNIRQGSALVFHELLCSLPVKASTQLPREITDLLVRVEQDV